MNLEQDTMLTPKQRQKIIDKALSDHYRQGIGVGVKKVPADYLLMFTEGGEADAIAYAIAAVQEHKTRRVLLREVYGRRKRD